MQPPLFYTAKSLYSRVEEGMCAGGGKERRKVTKFGSRTTLAGVEGGSRAVT